MERVHNKCCGVDLHEKLIVACLKSGSRQEIREFGATTRELLAMSDWLKDRGCKIVAMESTASCWKRLYDILEASGLKAIVVNARHMEGLTGKRLMSMMPSGSPTFFSTVSCGPAITLTRTRENSANWSVTERALCRIASWSSIVSKKCWMTRTSSCQV